jgi:hypothetical protein
MGPVYMMENINKKESVKIIVGKGDFSAVEFLEIQRDFYAFHDVDSCYATVLMALQQFADMSRSAAHVQYPLTRFYEHAGGNVGLPGSGGNFAGYVF